MRKDLISMHNTGLRHAAAHQTVITVITVQLQLNRYRNQYSISITWLNKGHMELVLLLCSDLPLCSTATGWPDKQACDVQLSEAQAAFHWPAGGEQEAEARRPPQCLCRFMARRS